MTKEELEKLLASGKTVYLKRDKNGEISIIKLNLKNITVLSKEYTIEVEENRDYYLCDEVSGEYPDLKDWVDRHEEFENFEEIDLEEVLKIKVKIVETQIQALRNLSRRLQIF